MSGTTTLYSTEQRRQASKRMCVRAKPIDSVTSDFDTVPHASTIVIDTTSPPTCVYAVRKTYEATSTRSEQYAVTKRHCQSHARRRPRPHRRRRRCVEMDLLATPSSASAPTTASPSYDSSCRTMKPSPSARQFASQAHASSNGKSATPSGSALASLARGSLVMGLSAESTAPAPHQLDFNNASSTSLGLGSASANNSEANTPMGESSNIIIGPNGTLIPRSSILLNPSSRKTFVDDWRVAGEVGGPTPAPTVLRIAAVPSEKDRALQRERERQEREQEIEREYREKEQAERVWGIPKKAFYLGMGEINFNAQMAMLGGWGNGSVGFPEMIAKAPVMSASPSSTLLGRRKTTVGLSLKKKKKTKRREGSGSGTVTPTGRPSSISSNKDGASTARRPSSASSSSATSTQPREAPRREYKDDDEGDGSDVSIDLEELAALNTIINTRRSMEAAQKLASSARNGLPATPSASSKSAARRTSTDSMPMTAQSKNAENQGLSARIRFAPVPATYNQALSDAPTTGMVLNGDAADEMDDADNKENFEARAAASEIDSDDEEIGEGDERWSRRLSGGVMKGGKWYLMGMPKSVFTPQYYRGLRRPTSGGGMEGGGVGEQQLSSSPSQERRSFSGGESERRGRVRSRGRSSRASSVKSRSSSVGSIDEEDRERRRQLILASRPGGTGMVTLPDGRKVRARRVGEEYSDDEEVDNMSEWGFARIARAAERRSIGDADAATGSKRMSDDEGGRESDFDEETVFPGQEAKSLTKRARRERMDEVAKAQTEQVSDDDDDDDGEDEDEDDVDVDENAVSVQSISPDESVSSRQEDNLPQEAYAPGHRRDGEPKMLSVPVAKDEVDQDIVEVRQPKRAMTIPNGPISLSASQAAEVRRRHEEEVAALGAEVLHNIAKAKKAKQAQMEASATAQPPQSPQTPSHSGQTHQPSRQQNASSPVTAGGSPPQSSYTLSSDTVVVQDDRGRSRSRPKKMFSMDDAAGRLSSPPGNANSSPLRNPLRVARGRLGGAASGTAKAGSISGMYGLDRQTSHQSTTSERLASRAPSGVDAGRLRTSTPPRVESVANTDDTSTPQLHDSPPQAELELADMTASIASLQTVRGRSASGEDRVAALVVPTSIDGDDDSAPSTELLVATRDQDDDVSPSPMTSQRSRSPKPQQQQSRPSHVPDLPSPWTLPRRPDARGYSVVPLPVEQLGRRPLRPQEGRFWQSDEEEDDGNVSEDEGDDEESTAGYMGKHARSERERVPAREPIDNSDDEADSDLDAEQLAEEERRTALQKKRATTRAAGAEVVSGLGGKHKAQTATTTTSMQKRSASRVDRRLATSRERAAQQLGRSISSTSLGRSKTSEMPISGKAGTSSRSNRMLGAATSGASGDNSSSQPGLSTTVLSTSRDKRGHSIARISRRRDTWNDFEELTAGADDVSPLTRASNDGGNDADDLDLSDVDDLWPPTLDNALGGSVSPYASREGTAQPGSTRSARSLAKRPSLQTKRMTSSASNLSINSHTGGGLSSSPVTPVSGAVAAQQLATYAAKARVVRERRERELRERERERARKQKEGEESLDYGWPRSLQGSSLY